MKHGALMCPRSDGGRGATERGCHHRSGTGLALSEGRGWRALVRVSSGDAGPVSVSLWVEGTGFSQRAAPASAHAEAASSLWWGDWGALTIASPSPQVHIPPPCSGAAPASAPPGPPRCPRDPSLRAAPRSAERRAGLLSLAPERGLASTSCAAQSSTVARITPFCRPSARRAVPPGLPGGDQEGPQHPACFPSGAHTSLQKPCGTASPWVGDSGEQRATVRVGRSHRAGDAGSHPWAGIG